MMEGMGALVTEPSSPKFVVSSGLLDVLKAEGAQGELFTKREIMNYLRSYICSRFLYDVKNPTLVHCENDLLGKALGVKMFTVNEVMKLLSSKVFLAAPLQKGSNGLLASKLSILGGVNGIDKRKSSDLDDEPLSKRHCAELLEPKLHPRNSPIYIDIYDAPDYDSSPETVLSVQGYETAAAKDSSDDLWFLETEEEYEVEIQTDEFDVEYEVNSLASSNSDHTDDSDTESDVADMEMVGAAILICQNDSDVEFWADSDSDSAIEEHSSSESDPEITDGDKWKCVNCSAYNRPLLRFCQKCWQLRTDWLPERRRPQRYQRRRRLRRTLSAPNGETARGLMNVRRRKTSRSMVDVTVVDEHSGSELGSSSSNLDCEATSKTKDLGDSSQESLQPSTSGVSSNEGSLTSQLSSLCSICLTRPKNASIVHGKIGHQTCCYSCGKKLWIRNKPCPICRRTIQKVIHNYIV